MHKLINFPLVINPLPPKLDFFFTLAPIFFFSFKPSCFQSEPESCLELGILSDGLGGKDYLCVHWFGLMMLPRSTNEFLQNYSKSSFKASWKLHLKVRTDFSAPNKEGKKIPNFQSVK